MQINKNSKIFIAGHTGMVGSSTLALFEKSGFKNLITKTSKELNLMDQKEVNEFLKEETPEIIILCAAKVGGIQANIHNPGAFLYNNLMIQNNVIHGAYLNKVSKLVFLGSSCIYPRDCPQPMKEEYLLTGKLEPTNESYAIAKITGIKMLESYYKEYGFNSISLMPCNLYGPNDSFDLNHSHVLSALIKRFLDAKEQGLSEITLWGTGEARRELMHVSDMSRSILFFLENYNSYKFINIGWGTDLSIKELAQLISDKTKYTGKILWDTTKPDGMPRKCMDVTNMKALGFYPKINIEDGVDEMIDLYRQWKQKTPT